MKPSPLRVIPKTPQESMVGEHPLPPPPVSVVVIKPTALHTAVARAKDKSLSSYSEQSEAKEAADGGKTQNALEDRPKAHTSKWPKIPKGKAAKLPKDEDSGWDPPAPRDSDPNAASHLLDWKGDWLPPPDWENRGRYTDHDEIKKWATWVDTTEHTLQDDMNINVSYYGSEITVTRNAVNIDHESYTTGSCEVVPRYWIPKLMEAQSLQQFWASFVRNSAPLSFEETEEDPSSLPQWTPFWLRFVKDGLPFNEPLPVPEYSMDEADEYHRAYETDRGSMHKKPARQQVPSEDRRARRKRRSKANVTPTGFYSDAVHLMPQIDEIPTCIQKLKVNCYLRVAKPCDDKQIANIYNHYVSNTVYAPEKNPRTVDEITKRRDEAHNNHFKCVVAVEKANRWRDVAGRDYRPSLSPAEEKIIGFAMAGDFTVSNSMYRYTSEMEVFVHQQYRNKGVGSTLLDRMIFLLDPDHKIRSEVEWLETDVELVNPGATRWVKSITMSVPFAFEKENERMQWIEKWLNKFGFEAKGEWDRVGIKLNSWYAIYSPTVAVALMFKRHCSNNNCRVSLRLFQKRTGSTVDPLTAT